MHFLLMDGHIAGNGDRNSSISSTGNLGSADPSSDPPTVTARADHGAIMVFCEDWLSTLNLGNRNSGQE